MIEMKSSISWQYGDYEPAADPDAALHLSLRILEDRMKDWSDVFTQVAVGVLQPEVSANIASEGEQFGVDWPPLSAATVKDRERRGYGGAHPMLIRDHTLADSFTDGDANHIQDVSTTDMEWGSALPYSLFLHTGTGGGYDTSVFGEGTMDVLGKQIMKQLGAHTVSMPGRRIISMTEDLQGKIQRKFTRAVYDTGNAAHFQTLWDGRDDIGQGEGPGGGE